MAEHGFQSLFNSSETLRETALLGLVAGLNSHRDEIDDQFRRRGLDLSALVDRINRCWAECGFPPRVVESTDEPKLLAPFL